MLINAPYLTSAPMHSEPVALVGSGPSLEETWEELKNYKTIFTCSRAHDFLRKKGIDATYHVDIDPGNHKPFLVSPTPVTTYLLHTGVNPRYWERVQQCPHQQFTFRGVQAGDTMIQVAHYMGYVNLHFYGYDSSGSGDEDFDFEGKTYKVDDNLLGSIVCFENTCRALSGLKVTVHGNGLLRAYLDRKYGNPIP